MEPVRVSPIREVPYSDCLHYELRWWDGYAEDQKIPSCALNACAFAVRMQDGKYVACTPDCSHCEHYERLNTPAELAALREPPPGVEGEKPPSFPLLAPLVALLEDLGWMVLEAKQEDPYGGKTMMRIGVDHEERQQVMLRLYRKVRRP